MKKLIALITVGFTFFVLGFIYEFHYPKLKLWVKTQIYLQSYEKLPVLIKVAELELSPFTLSASLEDVVIVPRKDLAKKISEIKIKTVEIRASLLSLFLGRFEISKIKIDSPKLTFVHKADPKAPPFKMPNIEFAEILEIPVDAVVITNGEILGRVDDVEQSIFISPLNLQLRKGFTSVFIELDLPEVKIKQKQIKDSLTSFGLFAKLSFSARGTKLVDLKITKENSYVVAKGNTSGNPLKLEFNSPTLLSSWSIDLSTIKDWIISYKKNWQIPSMSGSFTGTVNLVSKKNKNTFLTTSNLNDFTIEGFDIGNVELEGQLEDKTIEGSVKIKNKLQDVELAKIRLFLDQRYSFETSLNIKSFELNQMMRQIKVGDTPLKLQANGLLPCSGVIVPNFYANCSGAISISDFYVRNSSKNNIVAVQNFQAEGNLHVNKNFLVTDAKISVGKSNGEANARVDFATGYRVNYRSNNFNIEDVKEIAGLDIKGQTKVEGYSEGSSKKGVFVINMHAENAFFEKFYLGNLATKISYNSPFMKLENISGTIDTTTYAGDIVLNFEKDSIDMNLKVPNLNLSHLPKILESRFKLAFPMSGSGNMQAHIYGPLAIDKLNYDLQGQLQRILIGKESIDSIKIQTRSSAGNINVTGTELVKSRTRIKLLGSVAIDGTLNLDIAGTDIRLEESETVRMLTQTLSSITDLTGKVRGTITKPQVEAKLTLKQTNIGSSIYKDGTIDFKGSRESGVARVNLFNNEMIGSLQWNYDTKSPLLIDAVFNNWDYSPLFSVFSAKNEREGYKANIIGKLSVEYDLNNPMSSKVDLNVQKFLLARGILDIKNKNPMSLYYGKDGLSLRNFELTGNGSNILWTAGNPRAKQIALHTRGNVNLALISFLTPFLTDVRGNFNFQSTLNIKANSFEAIGDAKVSEGFAKLTEFPVPFEKIEADFNFSQNKIAINRFRSEFGGGLMRGSGNIAINNVKDVPIRIESVVDNANIQLSKGLELLASGNLVLSGNWFPYTLQGNLDIRRGLISQDDSEAKNRLRKSHLLPEALKVQELTPIELDITANLAGRNIKVVNEFVNTSIEGQLQISGNPVKPTLNGNITQADRGFIQFNENTFEIDNLNVNFNNDRNMNPNLYVLANTRVKEYDVTMTVGGTLQDIKPSFTSQPPLNEADIITLLTLGYTQSTLAEEQNETSGSGNAIGLGSAVLNRNPLNKQIEDKTGITLRFNSAVDSADENITVPKVEVSKKWNNRLETKASRTFGKTLKNDAKVQYKINDKVSVIGSWEAETNTDNSEFNNASQQDVFGVDLEYKIEFK